MRIFNLILMVATLVSLSACSERVLVRDYQAKPGEPQATLEVAVLDPMVGGETFDISIFTWHDCNTKPIYDTLAKFNGDNQPRDASPPPVSTKLPAERLIRLTSAHYLHRYPKTYYCIDVKEFTFRSGNRYRFQLHNRSAPNSKQDSIGCAYEIIETDASGTRKLQGREPPPVKCK
jgi:hypothetical protein